MMHDAKTRALLDLLEAHGTSSPELAGEYSRMSDLYSRKLWHQLTLHLESFVAVPAAATHLQPLYTTFVVDFKHRLNQLALARIQVAVAKQMADVTEQTAFCKAAAEECSKDDKQARSFILCELSRMLLDSGQVPASKQHLDDAAVFIESAAGLDNGVQASYYRAWAAYYKLKGPASEFYKHALLLLAYSPLSSMSASEALTISFDLGIAALVGEGLYNFGELLEHPVVATLEATDFAWLADLLRAFNCGDIAQYESLVMAHHAKLEQQPALLANTTFLKEKITLMCLTETLFQCIGPTGDRTVTFHAIASASNLPVDQVELLVMRALSLKLIRGLIDQVDGTLRVTWVQPRVLQSSQVNVMKDRLQTWCGTVSKTLSFLENETPEFST